MAEEPRVRLYYSLSAFNPKHHHAIINQRASKEEKRRDHISTTFEEKKAWNELLIFVAFSQFWSNLD